MRQFETNFSDDYSETSLIAEIKEVAARHAGPSLPLMTFVKNVSTCLSEYDSAAFR